MFHWVNFAIKRRVPVIMGEEKQRDLNKTPKPIIQACGMNPFSSREM